MYFYINSIYARTADGLLHDSQQEVISVLKFYKRYHVTKEMYELKP